MTLKGRMAEQFPERPRGSTMPPSVSSLTILLFSAACLPARGGRPRRWS
jgi:hypothetical protein